MIYPPGVPKHMYSRFYRSVDSGFRFGLTCVGIDIYLRFTANTHSFFSIKNTAEKEREDSEKMYAEEQEHSRRAFDDELKALRAKASGDVIGQDLLNQAYSNLLARVQ